jgi:hypothetical protein
MTCYFLDFVGDRLEPLILYDEICMMGLFPIFYRNAEMVNFLLMINDNVAAIVVEVNLEANRWYLIFDLILP